MWHMNDLGWGWWLVVSVGMIAFWILVIYAIVMIARSAGSPAGPAATRAADESPQHMIRRRLAAGDINVEEFERLRAVLDTDATEAPPLSSLKRGRT